MDEKKVTWPGWEVVRKIGSGSFGGVYEIRRDVFGEVEKAALKVISIPNNSDEIEDFRVQGYDDPSITQHFKGYLQDIVHEYSLMAKMKGHTNVVYCDDVRYVQHDDGIGWDIFIKMELLNPLMKNLHFAATEEQIIQLGIDICNALVLCKERNIIHRDIKPQNIFVSDDGNFKLGDFGIAKTVERTTGGTKVGTYKYMAPEVYNNQPYNLASDIYSLGLVLYWLLNEKRTPFLLMPPQIPTPSMEDEARLRRFRGDEIPAPAHGSEELKRIVLKACAFDMKDRYATAAEMLSDLKKVKKGAAAIPVDAPGQAAVVSAAEEPTEKITVDTADTDEGTVNIFSSRPVAAPVVDELTEYAREDKTEYIPRAAVVPPPEAPVEKPRKKAWKWIVLIAGLAAVIVLTLLLLHSCGGDHTPDSGTTSAPGQTEISNPSEESTEPSSEITEPDVTEPAVTEPAVTEPPATEPPITEPTVTEPPVTEPPVTEPPAPVTHTVPNVVGKSESTAKTVLTKLNFIVQTSYSKDDTVAEGNVIKQSIKEGTELEEGSTIILTISSGRPTISVNDVVGKTQAAAQSSLEAQGFKVKVVQAYSSTVASGYVISQSPNAGTAQYAGTEITITVSKGVEIILPTGVTLNKNSATLQIGETTQLSATIAPSNATDKTVTWKSGNTSVATVSANGLVTAVAPGTAVITVSTASGSKTATCTITVSKPSVGVISDMSMFVGDTKTQTRPSFMPSSATVTWKSSNTAVATVAASGSSYTVTAIAAGSATITMTVTAGSTSVTESFTVTVTKPTVTLSSYSGSETRDVYTEDYHYSGTTKPYWKVSLPTATANTGSSVTWEIVSGTATVTSSQLRITQPGKVVARAYITYNGTKYYADYTYTLSLTKTTTASNYLRAGHGTSYSSLLSIPKNKTVTITEVWWDTSASTDGTYWLWGKVTYGGKTGWIVLF